MTTEIARQVAARARVLVDALADVDLLASSDLPGWSRLTIACHLRYGAEALLRMTNDALAGRSTAYYPEGRSSQRPGTLEPRPGESSADVVRGLADTSSSLDSVWANVDDWDITVTEPDGNADLGPMTLAYLPLMRLTEVEVHGTDLAIGLGPWSDVLVTAALPARLERLRTRTPQVGGSWLVVATDGPTRFLAGDSTSEPAIIEATSRELFALTLGRVDLSESFSRAFPGP